LIFWTSNKALALLCAWAGIVPALTIAGEAAGETAHYAGEISKDRNQQFFAALAGKPVRRLVITSNGGGVAAGVELGLWVFERELDVEVSEYCLSSCANYVFPAGVRKTIRSGAVVAWHGNYRHLKETGLWTDEVAHRMEAYGEDEETARRRARERVGRLVRLERGFFARIGVDEYVCWIGKMPPYNAPNYYFLSRDDMARFGIRDVHTSPGYAHTDVSGFRSHIMYLELDEAGR